MLNVTNMGNVSNLLRSISPTDKLLYLSPGEGSRFSVPSGDHFYVTLRTEGRREFVRVNAVTGDTLSVERGQSSTAQSFPAGACVIEEWCPPQMGEFIALKSAGLGPSGVEPGTYCLNCNTCIDVDATGRITHVNNPGGCE